MNQWRRALAVLLAAGACWISPDTPRRALCAEPGKPMVAFPPGSRLLWDGDTAESSVIQQFGKLNEAEAVKGKCLEMWWPAPPERTNPVIVFGKRRPDIDLTGYDEIWFYAKSSEEGKTFDVDLSQWSGRKARANIDRFIEGGKLTTQWRLVKIPLAECTKTATWQNQVDHIVFPAKTESRATLPKLLYLDEVYAVKRSAPPAAPAKD